MSRLWRWRLGYYRTVFDHLTAANELRISSYRVTLGHNRRLHDERGNFLKLDTVIIISLGLIAFAGGTVGGVPLGKLMYKLTGGKLNPFIGSGGVSAVPMLLVCRR